MTFLALLALAAIGIPFLVDITALQLAIFGAVIFVAVLWASVWLAAHDARNYQQPEGRQ